MSHAGHRWLTSATVRTYQSKTPLGERYYPERASCAGAETAATIMLIRGRAFMISELAVGLLGDLLNTGLKRGVSVAFQKISRLQKVDLSSKGALVKNPLVLQALEDFQIVIGTYQGNYTVTLDAFLKDLSQSGVLDSMVENALIGRVSNETEKLFTLLHQSFFDDANDPAPLYKQIMSAFGTTLRELSKDTVLFSLAQASQRDLATRLERVDQALAGISSGLRSKAGPTAAELATSTLRIAKGLQQSYKAVRVETNRGPREVEINRIYVPPKLMFREGGANGRRLEALMRAVRRTGTGSSQGTARHGYFADQGTSLLNYSELADSFRRIVILGDPGGGKSTLCQKFCYDMAKNCALQMQFKDKSYLESGSYRLPIRIILRKFEQARATEPQLDMLTYIVRDIINVAGGDVDEVKSTVRDLLIRGRCILAFDGLDEILDTSMRQDYVDLVSAFCNQYPLCAVMVTSRFVGYDDARLSDEFEEIILQKFGDSEIEAYLIKFMRVVGGKTVSESKGAATVFLNQTSNTAKDLRRNPLMLGLMGWLFLSSGDVPSNRPEIYKECSVLMFERWDQRRGIIADAMSDFDRSQLFIHLAAEIYGEPKYAGGVSRSWLEASLQASFTELYESKAKAFRAAREFVNFVTGRAWVMSEVGDNVFSFTHQTFLEYFFARHLDDKYDSILSLLTFLKQRIIRSEWNEVSHLALQLKTHRSLRKQEEALSVLQRYAREARSSKSQNAILAFTSRSLEYISPPESKIAGFLEELHEAGFRKGLEGDTSTLPCLALAANSVRERRDFFDTRLVEKLSADVGGLDARRRKLAVKVINNGIVDYVERVSNGSSDYHLPNRITQKVRDRLSDKVNTEAIDNEFFAGLSWEWFGRTDFERMKKHGLAIIFNHPHLGSITDLDGLTALAVSASGVYGEPHTRSIVKPEEARHVLSIIGKHADELFPIERIKFNPIDFRSSPPDHVWTEIYRTVAGHEGATAGAIVVRRLSAALAARRRYRPNSSRPRSSARFKMEKDLALNDLKAASSASIFVQDIIADKVDLFSRANMQDEFNLVV